MLPWQRFNFGYIGYLNGTACEFRGSMAHVMARLSMAFRMEYDGGHLLAGTYHKIVGNRIADHFGSIEATFLSPDILEAAFLSPDILANEENKMMFQNSGFEMDQQVNGQFFVT